MKTELCMQSNEKTVANVEIISKEECKYPEICREIPEIVEHKASQFITVRLLSCDSSSSLELNDFIFWLRICIYYIIC